MNRILLLAAGFMACAVNSAMASDRVTVCAHYAVKYGWSGPYKVEATISDGTELNQSTGTLDYSPIDKYVVIFWSEDQASVIKLEGPYLGPYDVEGEDQQGRRWRLAETDFCL